jgi:hypothetical protein
VAYVRTVKTASGATAVQIVWSSRRGARSIEHLGSAHDGQELEALKALPVPGASGAEVGGGAGAGGRFPVVTGPIAGRVEQVVVEGGGSGPVPGDGLFAGGGGCSAFESRTAGGALVPPRVIEVRDGVAQLAADGTGVAADELRRSGLVPPRMGICGR